MSTTIHIELDVICLISLISIAYQSLKNVNQQMNRYLFRMTANGIMVMLAMDIVWCLIEGRTFGGAIFLNRLLNAGYLAGGVCLGCIWYLYVLETLGFVITRKLEAVVMLPGMIFVVLNGLSIKTEWIFSVSQQNIYSHGPYFWVQMIGAYGMIAVSFIHIIIRLCRVHDHRAPRYDVKKLLIFYAVTVAGSVVSLFETGMPGAWTCASVSIILIYVDDQNREDLYGMITAMAGDFEGVFRVDLYTDRCLCVRESDKLRGFMPEGKTFFFRAGFTSYADRCVSENDREAFLQFTDPDRIREALSHEPVITFRYLTRKNGAEQYEMMRITSITPVVGRDAGEVRRIAVGFSDVDSLTRSEMAQTQALTEALGRAEEANVAKTAFLSSMSHEIRTPMNAIIGFNNRALRDPDISRETHRDLEKIGSSAQHLLSLINDILDMSRIESGRMEIKEAEFSLGELLEQVDVIVGGQCEDKGLTYERSVAGQTDDLLLGDALRLRQVIINILGNAVKFTDPPGKVSLMVEQKDAYEDGNARTSNEAGAEREAEVAGTAGVGRAAEVAGAGDGKAAGTVRLSFTISDTGIGMDEDFLPKLFEPFVQEDGTMTNRYGGSGLGMAITKNMIDLMGGTISVESKKDCGTTFRVEVALKKAEGSALHGAEEEAGEGASLAGLHVLIVEDVELNAEITANLLEMENATSEWADNGRKAVEMFRLSRIGHFDVILMDMRMPVMDGVAAAREIRGLGRTDARTVPIIALTANAFEEDVKQCLQAGMDAHLSKPVEIDQLKKILFRMNRNTGSGD